MRAVTDRVTVARTYRGPPPPGDISGPFAPAPPPATTPDRTTCDLMTAPANFNEALAKLRERHGYDAHKIRSLHYGALIGLTARAVGAVVITCNAEDFRQIARYEPFELEVW